MPYQIANCICHFRSEFHSKKHQFAGEWSIFGLVHDFTIVLIQHQSRCSPGCAPLLYWCCVVSFFYRTWFLMRLKDISAQKVCHTIYVTYLPWPHYQECLLTLLGTITKRKRVSVQDWHQLLGELRSMSIAIPCSHGYFSFLQHALLAEANRIHITQPVHDQLLLDFLHLAQDISSCPTHIAKIVLTPPTYYGSMDAAKEGMGGV